MLPVTTILALPMTLLNQLLTQLIRLGTVMLIVYAILYKLGVIRRIFMYLAEREMRKLANGALVTIANLHLDIITGKVFITDLIIHSPHRISWQWDSPLIVRIGRTTVSFHLLSCIDRLVPYLQIPVKDIYSVEVEDIQVFVEKRRNVFNFHLLDPSLQIPDAKEVLDSILRSEQEEGNENEETRERGGKLDSRHSLLESPEILLSETTNEPVVLSSSIEQASKHTLATRASYRTQSSMVAETHADELVAKMLGAVSTLGRAANEGGKEGLSNALRNQKDGFVSSLKQFQTRIVGSDNNSASSSSVYSGPTEMTERPSNKSNSINSMNFIAKEGMRVMKHVTKVVEKNVLDMKQQVDSFSKPPPRKEGYIGTANDDLFRLGHVVVRDMRIFTKDMIFLPKNGGIVEEKTSATALASGSSFKRKPPPNTSGWSKPIHIKEMQMSSLEFCPSALWTVDEKSGIPLLGLKADKILDILMKRTLAEMAKSNTGRLLQNAFGEVFAWMEVKGNNGSNSACGGGESKRMMLE